MGVHFVFEFSDYRTEDPVVQYRFPILTNDTDKLADFASDSDDSPWLDFTQDVESDYGCHDYYATLDPDNFEVGFASAEVEKEQRVELMQKWKDFFEKNGYQTGAIEFMGEVAE